ncbi:hypothetical protein [Planococcus sp. YIM B11945]|uniref:hypothetical protein n=1 Tax=Planococcus sp. YIM B11945 TaxID=3435410 RepID=UPI003D7EA82F
MDEQTTKLLMKKLKKFKKWTENVFINPIYWKVNNKPYYMAWFTKNHVLVGTAFVTIGEETLEEVMVAQPKLLLFVDLSTIIFQVGAARLKIESSFYINPLNIAVATKNREVLQGREAYAELWSIQQKFNRLVRDYRYYYDHDVLARQEITDADVEKTQKIANQVNMYQYMTLTTLLEKNGEIRSFADFLETTKGGKELEEEQLAFVKGITENREIMYQSLRRLNMAIDEDEEKMLQLNYERMIEKNNKIIESQRKFIRYPKFA